MGNAFKKEEEIPIVLAPTILMSASLNGDTLTVCNLLKHGVDVNESNSDGWTALLLAAKSGHTSIVEILLKYGSKVDAKNADGVTALMLASMGGHNTIIKLLHSFHCHMDDEDKEKRSAVTYAAMKGHISTVKELLKFHAIADSPDLNGLTPFLYAAKQGHLPLVRYLLELEDHKICVDCSDNNRTTAVMFAAEIGHAAMVEYLLKKDADINTSNNDYWTPLMFAVKKDHLPVVKLLLGNKSIKFEMKVEHRQTPLMIAAIYGHTIIIDLILKKDPSCMNIVNERGYSALMLAAESGQSTAVKILMTHGSDVTLFGRDGLNAILIASKKGNASALENLLSFPRTLKNDCNNTLLKAAFMAAENVNNEITEMLLKYGCNINQKNELDMTLLMIACKNGQLETVKCLVHRGSKLNKNNSKGWTALMFAAKGNHKEIATVLVQSGCKIDKTSNEENTALMIACKHGSKKVVKILIEHNANMDKTNSVGQNALMIACRNGHRDIVKVFLKCYVNLNEKDRDSLTAVQLAHKYRHMSIEELLIRHGAVLDNGESKEFPSPMLALKSDVSAKERLEYNKVDEEKDFRMARTESFSKTRPPSKISSLHQEVHPEKLLDGYNYLSKLMSASITGDLEQVDKLIYAGCDINESVTIHWNALMFASLYSHRNVVETLINYGSRNDLDYLMAAVAHNKPLIFKKMYEKCSSFTGKILFLNIHEQNSELLNEGGNVTLPTNITLVTERCTNVTDFQEEIDEQLTKVYSFQKKVMELSKSTEILPIMRDRNNYANLYVNLMARTESFSKTRPPSKINSLQQKVDQEKLIDGNESLSKLMFASITGDLEQVDKLIYAGCDINENLAIHMNALMFALLHENLDVVETLINYGGTFNEKSQKVWNEFMATVAHNKPVIKDNPKGTNEPGRKLPSEGSKSAFTIISKSCSNLADCQEEIDKKSTELSNCRMRELSISLDALPLPILKERNNDGSIRIYNIHQNIQNKTKFCGPVSSVQARDLGNPVFKQVTCMALDKSTINVSASRRNDNDNE